MKVRLKDSIISELTCLGLRPGMVVKSTSVNKTTGAVDFTHYHNSAPYDCVVWPEDYEIVEEEPSILSVPISEITFSDASKQITLPILDATNALDAMHWCICPYLDNSDLSEFPWIQNLIKSYNDIVSVLPSPYNLQYDRIEI